MYPVIARYEAIWFITSPFYDEIASYLAMTGDNIRLICNRIALVLENHGLVSFKINADASGRLACKDE